MLNASSNTFQHKSGLAKMLKNGVIMDVTNPEQAKIAEEAGAVAVMALERVPADIRREVKKKWENFVEKFQEYEMYGCA